MLIVQFLLSTLPKKKVYLIQMDGFSFLEINSVKIRSQFFWLIKLISLNNAKFLKKFQRSLLIEKDSNLYRYLQKQEKELCKVLTKQYRPLVSQLMLKNSLQTIKILSSLKNSLKNMKNLNLSINNVKQHAVIYDYIVVLRICINYKFWNLNMFLENITEEQIQQFRQAFALFDKDGDGTINNKQLKTVLRSLGHNPTKEQLDMFISLIDEDKSGTIDFRQFLILISQRLNEKTLLDEVIEAFKIFDRDQDGYLTRIQVKQLLLLRGFEDLDYIDDIMDQVDDGQGLISCNVFVEILLGQHVSS